MFRLKLTKFTRFLGFTFSDRSEWTIDGKIVLRKGLVQHSADQAITISWASQRIAKHQRFCPTESTYRKTEYGPYTWLKGFVTHRML